MGVLLLLLLLLPVSVAGVALERAVGFPGVALERAVGFPLRVALERAVGFPKVTVRWWLGENPVLMLPSSSLLV